MREDFISTPKSMLMVRAPVRPIETAAIYTDNQAALKTLRRADTPANQDCVRHILNAVERLATRRVQVQLRWVPDHRGVKGNKLADKTAREIAEHGARETAPIPIPLHREQLAPETGA